MATLSITKKSKEINYTKISFVQQYFRSHDIKAQYDEKELDMYDFKMEIEDEKG